MNFLFSILPTVVVLGILITIHELGHFIACRLSKVRVEKFSIGFGPEIFHWQGRETRYVVSIFPLGGYVKPAGESLSEVGEEGLKPDDFLGAPLVSRIFIVVAGVVMNYVLAFVLFTAIFMMGRPVPGTVIGGFVDGYPAQKSGLEAGDKVLQINGRQVKHWPDLTAAIEKSDGEVQFTVQRSGRTLVIPVTPKVDEGTDIFGEKFKTRRIGVKGSPAATESVRFGFIEAVTESGRTVAAYTVLTHKAIFHLIIGKMSLRNMSGPIGIISMTGDAAQQGLTYLLQLMAMLSVSLAVINLLPIPALDGGHLLFLLIEAVRRKKISLAAQEKATQVGFILLMTLMVFILYNDLQNMKAFEKLQHLFAGPH